MQAEHFPKRFDYMFNGKTVTLAGNVGTCVLDARQDGGSNYFPVTVVAQSFVVGPANTFVSLVSSSSSTGQVTIKEKGVALATASLNGGTASAVFKLQAPGLHTITATYGGDSSNGQSSCAAVPVQVKFDPALMLLLFPDGV